ncbi:hypothetical protein CDAR_124291 [Caerostris darwini]|uniref:Uncharacterized protein n=1 Tax=Caerostris darwini TaxID=1538125 RepID=A0AAV4RB47_9ARAC|nr:hypothetical protein CDAR_124291 [Caerostris darwini]
MERKLKTLCQGKGKKKGGCTCQCLVHGISVDLLTLAVIALKHPVAYSSGSLAHSSLHNLFTEPEKLVLLGSNSTVGSIVDPHSSRTFVSMTIRRKYTTRHPFAYEHEKTLAADGGGGPPVAMVSLMTDSTGQNYCGWRPTDRSHHLHDCFEREH